MIWIVLPPVVHDVRIESFWANFEMMTSQHGAWISRFWEKSFINEYFTSKFLLLLIFIFLSQLLHEVQVWALFLTQIWVNVVTTGNQNFKILRERFRKRVTHLKVFFTFDFHLSINIGTWNTNLDLFELGLEWQSPHGKSKL